MDGQWGVQRGDLKRDLPFLKLQLEEKNQEWTRRGIKERVAVLPRGLISSSQHLQKRLNPESETLG